MSEQLPSCMMPDGAEPCEGYRDLLAERDALQARLDERVDFAKLEYMSNLSQNLHDSLQYIELKLAKFCQHEHKDEDYKQFVIELNRHVNKDSGMNELSKTILGKK